MTKPINPMLTRCSALALSTSLLFLNGVASAQSFNGTGTVVEGDAVISEGSGTTTITLETQSAVIDWTPDDDNILPFQDIAFQDTGTTATFTNGTGISSFAVLNRILPSDVTRRIRFDGNIISTIQDGLGGVATGGTVFFYSPGGIIIGPNAVIDVGSLGLTTAAPVTDGSGTFIINNQVQFQQSLSEGVIAIDPGAQINALNEGSYVALFAPRIDQLGDIAVNGSAALVSGEAGSITFSPDGLFDIEVTIGSDAGIGIDHRGTTGGPGSSGAGDNHRVYAVTVAKNDAITMTINGGSDLGFDVAQSAFVDGNAVVLAAGHNIVGSEIDPTNANANSDGSTIRLTDDEQGFGTGLLFRSRLDARAQTEISGFLTQDIVFEADARLASGSLFFDLADDGTRSASLIARGDFEMIADSPVPFGDDVGLSFLSLFDGATAQFDGDLLIASRAQNDGNGDGIVQSNFARAFIGEGATLNVDGNLIIDAGIDLRDGSINATARSGFAQIFAEGGTATIGGVTRIISDAYAAAGSRAESDTAEVLTFVGGQITTGELNISADAFGGIEDGFTPFAGSAQAGRALISLFDTGSSLTVLSPNSSGTASAGELDFLSSEAFGADGITSAGGEAASGETVIRVQQGATINLPDVAGSPLLVRNTATGGNTSASDSFAGNVFLGQIIVEASGADSDLGRLSVLLEGLGGSALAGAQRTSGGNVTGGDAFIFFSDGAFDMAFDDIRSNLIGGTGSTEGSTTGGAVFGNSIAFNSFNADISVLSDLRIISTAEGGTGAFGGFSRATNINFQLDNSNILVAGGLLAQVTSMGGASLGSTFVDPQTGDTIRTRGGDADVGSITLDLNNSAADVGNDLTIMAQANGGSGDLGGSSTVSFIGSSLSDSNISVAGNLTVDLLATGGDAFTANAIDPISGAEPETVGGDANVFDFQINAFNSALDIGGSISLASNAAGGDAQDTKGGIARTGLVDLRLVGTSSVIASSFSALSQAVGGSILAGGVGRGGSAETNNARLITENDFLTGTADNTITVSGDVTLTTSATGGSGGDTVPDPQSPFFRDTTGGNASSGFAALDGFSAGNLGIGGNLTATSTARGGSSVTGSGGSAFANPSSIVSFGLNSIIEGNADFLSQAFAGAGLSGGDANAEGTRIVLQNSGTDILGVTNMVTRALGGNALSGPESGSGGNAFGGFSEINLLNSQIDIDLAQFIQEARGGSGSNNAFTAGGNANAGFMTLAFNNSIADFRSGIELRPNATGGSGFSGGSVDNTNANFDALASTINVAGDITIDLTMTGGDALGESTPDPINQIAGGSGGDANLIDTQAIFFVVDGTTLTSTGAIAVTSSSTGGDAVDGTAGSAVSGEIFAQFRDASVVNASQVTISGVATGGSVLAGGSGDGGNATALRVVPEVASFDPFTGQLRPNTNAVVNADLIAGTSATGGDAGSEGGNGGQASTQLNTLATGAAGTFTINGNVILSNTATGGNAPLGIGGSAQSGGSEMFGIGEFDQATGAVGPSSDVTINGDLTLSGEAFGGEGRTGGDATGPLLRMFTENGSHIITGTATLTTDVIGGDALASETPGAGGNAIGNTIIIQPQSQIGQDPTLISLGSLVISDSVQGGKGGDGLAGADGGQGGEAVASGSLVLARAFDGTLTIANPITIIFQGIGGAGGNGVNGGDGGLGASGTIQFGTASGSALPGATPISGSTNIDTVTITNIGVGGAGGDATTGTGGNGGDGQGRFTSLLSRGAPVNANSITLSSTGIGGAGGQGATQGDGGDGVAGVVSTLLTQAFQNDGRGSTDIGSLVMRSEGIGGAGATPGSSFYASGGQMSIIQSDATIGSIDVLLLGNDFPDFTFDDGMGNQVPVTVNPFLLNATNGTLSAGAVSIVTPGEVETAFASSQVDVSALSILAGALVLPEPNPDPQAPPPDPDRGVINATGPITLSAAQSNLAIDAALASGADISLNALGNIAAGDLTAPSVFLNAINGTISTLSINTQGGEIVLESEDTIDLDLALADIDATSVVARSLAGDVIGTLAISLAGSLSLEAAQSILVGDISAETINALAEAGGIITGTLDTGSGAITLEAATSVLTNGVNAGSLSVFAAGGDFADQGAITLGGTFDAFASGAISLGDVTAQSILAQAAGGDLLAGTLDAQQGALDLVAQGSLAFGSALGNTLFARATDGEFSSTGPISVVGGVDIESGNALILGDVTAGSITATSLGARLEAGSLLAEPGAVNLSATELILSDIIAGTALLNASTGSTSGDGSIVVANAFELNSSGSINLDDITAGSITIGTTSSLQTGVLDAGEGAVLLTSGDSLVLPEIAAGSINAISTQGDILSDGPIAIDGALALDAAGSIMIGSVSADAITALAEGGDINASGDLNAAGLVDLEAQNRIDLVGVIADSLRARTSDGGLSATGLLNLAGLLDVNAGGAIDLVDVNAGSIEARNFAGDLLGEGNITVTGTASFNSAGILQLGDITASQISTTSQAATLVGGAWTADRIELTTPFLQILMGGVLNAGVIALNSTNENGLLVGDDGEQGQAGLDLFELTEAMLASFTAGELTVTGAANLEGPDIFIGSLNLASAGGIGSVGFATSSPDGLIRVIGDITSDGEAGPGAISFESGRFELDTDLASVDLLASGATLAIAADLILVGTGSLISATTGEEAPDALLASFNAPATEPGAGSLFASAITLEGGRAILIQNAGTEEAPAGFVVSSAEGLQFNARTSQTPLVIINGQIGTGADAVTGLDAGTAFLEALGNAIDISAQSQINGCALGGCIVTDQGEVTSDVSAQVNGVIDAGGSSSGGASGGSGGTGNGTDTGGGDTGSGDTGGSGDGGSDDSGTEDGGDEGGEDSGDANAGAGSAGTGSGSDGSGDANPDNVDDGGGGNEDFDLDEGSDGGDEGGGSDDGASDEGASDEGGEAEGGEEETEGGEDEAETEEAEETEEEEGEEEEEESSEEEEEEDSEGPTTGPIQPPSPLIDTNTLEQNTVINDPISSGGNPGLLDPDVDLFDPASPAPSPTPDSTGSQ